MTRLITLGWMLFVIATFSCTAAEFTWSNPLNFQYTEGQAAPRKEVRGPCIIREGDTYYLVFTMHPLPTWEHYAPVLVAAGAVVDERPLAKFPITGWWMDGAFTKRSVQFG